jgi:CHU_C Type IX secretion signal domain/SprB repeat
MKNRALLSVIFFLWIMVPSFSQNLPPICGPNPTMVPFCKDACIICDIDGFKGRNNFSSEPGNAPDGFCTTVEHNIRWIGFVAGTTNLKISIQVTNCEDNDGLEVGLYQSDDCINFKKVSFCDTDIRENQTTIFTNTVPLIIGQHYYIVMDGSGGDVCDWTFKVLEGTTRLGLLDGKTDILSPDTICIKDTFIVSALGVVGASDYLWQVDGNIVKSGQSIELQFLVSGTYNLCVTPRNVCQIGQEFCKKITVIPTNTTELTAEICQNECYNWHGQSLCLAGDYTHILPNQFGCDSILKLNLEVLAAFDEDRNLSLCMGDTLIIENERLTMSGNYNIKRLNSDGCEITLHIDLNMVDCAIQTRNTSESLKCYHDLSGEITFSVINGVPPFSFSAYLLENTSVTLAGNISQLNANVKLDNLSAGIYAFTIEDKFGRESFFYTTLDEPKVLKLTYKTSEYNGYEISCFSQNDGSIFLNSSGGVIPYVYIVNNKLLIEDSLTDLKAGFYDIKLVDKNGCTLPIMVQLKQPDTLIVEPLLVHPNCSGNFTGSISISSTTGGAGDLEIILNDTIKDNPREDLGPGIYKIVYKDKNGCQNTFIDTLIAAEIPDIKSDNYEFNINLGDSVNLDYTNSLDYSRYIWTPNLYLSCDTCLSTIASPVNNVVYQLTATSKDDCIIVSENIINVKKIRSFVISNIVNLNSIGGNNYIKYHTERDVASINFFTIYDRWGSLVFRSDHLQPGLQSLDWDFKFNGREVNTGIYSWVAQVVYKDDVVLFHKGDLTIVR